MVKDFANSVLRTLEMPFKRPLKSSSFSKFLILSPPQTAELGTAAPDIIILEIFCAPELHNIYVAQYRYCSMAIARYYTSK
jgi:hypothetical protein